MIIKRWIGLQVYQRPSNQAELSNVNL